MGTTTPLRNALRKALYPHAEAKGFVIYQSKQPQFTTFRRIVGETVQVFDIMFCWFQLRKPLLHQLVTFKREYGPEEVATHVPACFAEMEQWWLSRAKGPHVYGMDAV